MTHVSGLEAADESEWQWNGGGGVEWGYMRPLLVFVFAACAYGQMTQLASFLQLTDEQVNAIQKNNDAYNALASDKRQRISQVQNEITVETAKEFLDPMAIGVRYAEIEAICRVLMESAVKTQKTNLAVLNDAQTGKLKVLEDAMALAPVIGEGQGAGMLGAITSAPWNLTGAYSNWGSPSGYFMGGLTGCRPFAWEYMPTAAYRADGR